MPGRVRSCGGPNGKSTYWETVLDLLGEYGLKAGSNLIMLHARDSAGRATPERVQLLGERLVVLSEVDAAHRLHEAQLKDLIGGDRVTGRDVYKPLITFSPTHKLVLYGNHKPNIQGADGAVWARLYLIPCPVKIPEEEQVTDFRERSLLPELSGILAWAVRGCLDWQQQGLRPPLDITEARNTYRREMDVVLEFLTECCERRDGVSTASQTLYTVYSDWCRSAGVEPLTQRAFNAALEARGLTKSKRGSMVWHGLKLRLSGSSAARPRLIGSTGG